MKSQCKHKCKSGPGMWVWIDFSKSTNISALKYRATMKKWRMLLLSASLQWFVADKVLWINCMSIFLWTRGGFDHLHGVWRRTHISYLEYLCLWCVRQYGNCKTIHTDYGCVEKASRVSAFSYHVWSFLHFVLPKWCYCAHVVLDHLL